MFATFKKFIRIFGVLSIGLLLVSTWFLYSSNRNHQDMTSERQLRVVNLVADAITRDLYSNATDARFLSRLVARYTEHEHDGMHALEDFFADFSRSRDYYFSLRYLDNMGNEVVRVDRSYAGPVITPRSVLQNKSDRYYFKETAKANRNDVYVSNFDLNIEHGKLEMPYRPTLRFSSPVMTKDGGRLGVVVLSFEGRTLLNDIRLEVDAGAGSIMLCNEDGYWMLGEKAADEWGHIIDGGQEMTMANRFPDEWRIIANETKGQVSTDNGLFSFNTVGVTPRELISEEGTMDLERSDGWKVLTWVPEDRMTVPWMNFYIIVACVLLGLVGMASWHVADNRVHQEEVESMLRENEERTMAISQSSQDAIAMINSRGSVIHWNPAAERLFGYTSSEAMGLGLHELLAQEPHFSMAVEGLKQFAGSGQGEVIGKVIEFPARHKNGTTVPVELAASSFKFKGEWYAVGSMRDITRRRQSEAEVKRSEETSRALINAPTESAMLISLNGSIEAINEVGADRLGSTVDELIGKNALTLISPELAEKGREYSLRIQQTGEPIAFEDERGERRMLINIYPVFGADEAVDRLAIFMRDVTEQRAAEAALMQSENRFRDVSEAVGEVIWETDVDGIVLFVTDDILQLTGYSPAEIVGQGLISFLPDEDVDDFNHWRMGVYDRQEPFANIEARFLKKDRSLAWLAISGTPHVDAEGEFLGYRGAALDITERKAAETSIKASERKLRALAESAYDAIVMIDARGLVSFWNDAAEQLFGYTEEEVFGKDIHALVSPPEDIEKAEEGMGMFARTGSGPAVGAVTEVVAVHKDGSRFAVERSIASFRLEDEWYAVATIRDITERKATEAKLRELATTDSLTGLNNRRRFMELCEREFTRSVRYGRPLAMFMLDIDHFKRVNDEYGHDVGDQVLRSLSEISVLALRNADILGRLGGEEFGVLLPETDAESAYDVAERLRLSIERASISANGASLKITVSIGVSILSSDNDSISKLLKGADVALYQAKQSGRNKVIMG